MRPIPQLIFNLLAERKQVVLPGLGTLYTEFSGVSSVPDGDLSAPQVRVLFRPTEEPGQTLPEIIADRSGIPLKEIRPQYNRWVDDLRGTASDGGLAIEGVVLLLRQPDGSYWAQPAKELDRLLNPSDRKSFRLSELPVSKGEAQKPARNTNGAKKASKPQNDPNLKRRAAWLAVGGAVLVFLFFAGYFAYTRGYFETKSPEHPIVSPERPGIIPPDAPVFADSLTDKPEPLPDSLRADSASMQVIDSEPTTGLSSPGELPAGHTGVVYHIIAGVFSSRENAERFVREEGFDASRVTLIAANNGRYMVSIGRFAEKESADVELRRVHAAIPQAWISKRKE